MTDRMISEEFGFEFQYLGDPYEAADECCDTEKTMKEQRLVLSRDLTKLMEVYQDSKCRIYGRSGNTRSKKVQWDLLH